MENHEAYCETSVMSLCLKLTFLAGGCCEALEGLVSGNCSLLGPVPEGGPELA